MEKHDEKNKNAVPVQGNSSLEKTVNQSVKGLSIVRLSLTKAGYKHDSAEVKRIDELIMKHSK
jgi:hypothetical protein